MDSCTSWALSAKSSSLNCVQQESVPSHLALHLEMHLIALSLSVNAYITCSSSSLFYVFWWECLIFSSVMRCFMACYCSVAMQTAEQTHYILVKLHWKHFSSSYWSTDCVALFFLCSHSFDFDMWRRRRAEWNQFVLSETCYSAADVCQMLSQPV